jgi:hypothetical protein
MLVGIVLALIVKKKKEFFMINFFTDVLRKFRPAFSRRAAFNWFVIVMFGLLIRSDFLGITSIVRALSLPENCYFTILNFFHSSAWNDYAFLRIWWTIVYENAPLYKVNDRVVLIGDHTKQPKNSRKMPEVATQHQESETATKPGFFKGHEWGAVSMLAGNAKKFFSIPLWFDLSKSGADAETKTVEIISAALQIALCIGCKVYLVLDAFFASCKVFNIAFNSSGLIIALVRGKKNVVAYLDPEKPLIKKRGRPKTYGRKIKVHSIFSDKRYKFAKDMANIYGVTEEIEFLYKDLIWKPVKRKIRFILVRCSRGEIILMSSSFELMPIDAVEMYCKRTYIESMFNNFKNLLGGMTYRFWSKFLKKISRRPLRKSKEIPFSSNPEKTEMTTMAIKRFVRMQMIVLGIIQIAAFKFPAEIFKNSGCWLRTAPKEIPSEFIAISAARNLCRRIFFTFHKNMENDLINSVKNRINELNKFDDAA